MSDFRSSVSWNADTGVLASRFSGIPDLAQVEGWKHDLWSAVARLPRGAGFKFLMDLRGYSVDDVPREVHFAQRTVVPEFLLAHGFRIGYLNMYAEKAEPAVPEGAVCVAAANVHHECYKMEFYQEKFGGDSDRYFCDPEEAGRWIKAHPGPATPPG